MKQIINQEADEFSGDTFPDQTKKYKIIIIILSGIIILLVATLIWFFLNKNNKVSDVAVITDVATTTNNQAQIEESGINVVWEKSPVLINSFWADYIKSSDFKNLSLNKTNLSNEKLLENVSYPFRDDVYKVGLINNGKYAGKDLYLSIANFDQFSSTYFLVVLDSGYFNVLKVYSDGFHSDNDTMSEILKGGVKIAYESSILISVIRQELSNFVDLIEPPKSININGLVFNRATGPAFNLPTVQENAEIKTLQKISDNIVLSLHVKRDESRDFFNYGRYYIQDASGVAYEYLFPNPAKISLSLTKQDLVNFNYTTPISSCGLGDLFADFNLTTKYSDKDFVEIGKTSDNMIVYELQSDKKLKELKELFILYNQNRKCGVPGPDEACLQKYEQSNQSDLNKFIQQTPIIFIKDPFNNFIRFIKKDFALDAYCG